MKRKTFGRRQYSTTCIFSDINLERVCVCEALMAFSKILVFHTSASNTIPQSVGRFKIVVLVICANILLGGRCIETVCVRFSYRYLSNLYYAIFVYTVFTVIVNLLGSPLVNRERVLFLVRKFNICTVWIKM